MQNVADALSPCVPRIFDAERFACGFQETNERATGAALIGPKRSSDRGARIFSSDLHVDRHYGCNPIVHSDIALVLFRDRQPTELDHFVSCLVGPPFKGLGDFDGLNYLRQSSNPPRCCCDQTLILFCGPRQDREESRGRPDRRKRL